jgi:hypothetical protein
MELPMTNYTQQDYERDVKIRDGAYPEAVTTDIAERYFNADGNLLNSAGFISAYGVTPEKPRSLDDIRNLVAMYEREQELIEYIHRLEKAGKLMTAGKLMNINLTYSLDSFAPEYKKLWAKAKQNRPEMPVTPKGVLTQSLKEKS